MKTDSLCPCLSGKTYPDCCQPFHTGERQPETAELLMRSRYCAFNKGLLSYLIATLHPGKRQADDKQALQETIAATTWLGLKVVNHQQTDDDHAEVEFIAFYQDNPIGQLHENSRFIRTENRWYYLDGETLPPIKLGRNETCFCGSGKKLKHCHG